jgi:synaptojanin
LPAWTDRILYKGKKIELSFYTCIESVNSSDHKPVCALFHTKIAEGLKAEKVEMVKRVGQKLLKNSPKGN